MEKIKIKFLGTGDAIPTKKRNHSAILVSFKNENILIDCGEGTQRQMRIANISHSKLTRILITHRHGDHTLGLPGLFQTLAMHEYKKTLQVYGPKGIKRIISTIEELIRGFNISLKVSEGSIKIKEKDFTISSLPMSHGTPANAYSIKLNDKIRLDKKKLKKYKLPNSPLLRKLQEGKSIKYKGKIIRSKDVTYKEKGKKITFIMDTKININAIRLAKDSDLLVCESAFLEKDKAKATKFNHMTAKQAATIAKKAKVKKLIITHVSQRYEKNLSDVLKEAEKTFKKTELAKDFMSIEI